jgi:hypothetical protein
MDKDKLSPKEQALLAAARRGAGAGLPAQPEAPPQSAAERLERLIAEEREQTQERKRKMRRNGLMISGAILGLFALWLLSSLRRRR